VLKRGQLDEYPQHAPQDWQLACSVN